MRGLICLSLLSLAANISQAHAQDSGEIHYVTRPRLPLCVEPGGSPRAELNIGTPVKTFERRGDWVRVSVDGWVRSSLLSKQVMTKDAIVVSAEEAIHLLGIVDQRVVLAEEEGVRKVVLKLTLKNLSAGSISSWSGILAVLKGSQVLFHAPLSQDKASIPAGETGEAAFHWDETEAPYAALKANASGGLDFRLLRVKVK